LIIMTKTFVLTVLAVAIAPVAMAQTVFVGPAPRAPRAPLAAPAPLPAPAPMPAPAVAIGAPFAAPPVPPEPPQAPQPTVAPLPPTPAPVLQPFDIDFDLDFDDFHIDIDPLLGGLGQGLAELKESLKQQKFELKAQEKGIYAQGPRPVPAPFVRASEEASYDQARSMIERDQYDRALPVLDRVIQAKGSRVDAAMYWKAYSLSKLARRPEALTVLSDLQKEFPNGAWVRDARSLEVEVRQASGQSVAADMPDDEVKVLALRGLMQSDPEAAVPAIERILQGSSSVRVKDRALFVLSQNRTTRARDIISGVAANGSNPELRLSAVRYLGMRQDPESLKTLADLYSSQTDLDVRRAILRSLGAAQARDRLLAVAKTEKTPELRAMAVQQLGAARGSAELEELYRSETDKEVKQRILQSFIAANAADKLAVIARSEKDPDLQRMAIRNLGATNRPEAIDALRAIYLSDAPIETKRAVINALSVHQDCSALVALAKAEKNKELQTAIISQLANQSNRCPEARDYMLELLK
jgi:HEAT repeat protein